MFLDIIIESGWWRWVLTATQWQDDHGIHIVRWLEKTRGVTEADFFIRGGPEKNGTAYFPQYLKAITGISVWGNVSWKKRIPKFSNFGLVVCFLGHNLWDNVEVQNVPIFSLNYYRRELLPFQLATAVSSNTSNFVNANFSQAGS